MANIIEVSALNRYVKSLLEENEFLRDIAIRGEISNFKRHDKTGHCYFTLKDKKADVRAVMFRSAAASLSFTPENGMCVLARCRVSLYEKDGSFQLYVDHLFPDGMGTVQQALEQLKTKLQNEGVFAEENKKPLPSFPEKVGLVTSKTGAALQDILQVAERRCPNASFLMAPVTVQGLAAAPAIAAAIRALDASGQVDVIIVARGGGSSEDLWVFNDEEIVRAAFLSGTPIVSAIGHETDVTLLDFAADLRAPTPSAAAELVLPNLWEHFSAQMEPLYINIQLFIQARVEMCYNILVAKSSSSILKQVAELPKINTQELDNRKNTLCKIEQNIRAKKEEKLKSLARLAVTLSPYAVLGRGYAVVHSDGKPVKTVKNIQAGQELMVQMHDGQFDCTVSKASIIDTNKEEANAPKK